MITGQITLNGISDSDLVLIWKAKVKHEAAIQFNPQPIQSQMVVPTPGKPPIQRYNNVNLTWNSEQAGKAVVELLKQLVEEPERAPGQ